MPGSSSTKASLPGGMIFCYLPFESPGQ